jgi:hypothetical protein
MWKCNRARMTAMAVATTLIGTLLVFGGPASAEDADRNSVAHQVGEASRGAWDAVRDAWASGKETARNAWQSTKETARDTWSSGKETAKDGWNGAKETTHEVTKDVKEGWKKD